MNFLLIGMHVAGSVLFVKKTTKRGFEPQYTSMPSTHANLEAMQAQLGRANTRLCLDGLHPSCLGREGSKLTRINDTTASKLAF